MTAGARPDPEAATSATYGRQRRWVIVLLVLRLAVVCIFAANANTEQVNHDSVRRFQQIATSQGLPYRDYEVEYAPIEAGIILLIGGAGTTAVVIRVLLVSFCCDLASTVILGRVWGNRTALSYLVLGTPLFLFMYLRLDFVSVLLVVAAVALLRRAYQAAGGSALGVAIFTRLWALAVVPLLVVERRWKALAWTALVATAGMLVWLGIGGMQGPRQVFTFRGSTGWEFESLIGLVTWIVGGDTLRLEHGALRIGHVPGWAPGVLTLVGAVLTVAIWSRARHAALREGRPALASVASILVLSPLFSLQYVTWLLPWAAIAGMRSGGRQVERATFVIAMLTGALWVLYEYGTATPSHVVLIKLLLVARNGLCLFLLIDWFVRPIETDADVAPY